MIMKNLVTTKINFLCYLLFNWNSYSNRFKYLNLESSIKMVQNVMTLTRSNFKKFIQDIERKYGHTVASKVTSDLIQLATIAQTNDYLDELNSPRFVARFKLHPLTGRLIVETINDEMKGYRYTVINDKVTRTAMVY